MERSQHEEQVRLSRKGGLRTIPFIIGNTSFSRSSLRNSVNHPAFTNDFHSGSWQPLNTLSLFTTFELQLSLCYIVYMKDVKLWLVTFLSKFQQMKVVNEL